MGSVGEEALRPVPQTRLGFRGSDDDDENGDPRVEKAEDGWPPRRLLHTDRQHDRDEDGEQEGQEVDVGVKAGHVAEMRNAKVAQAVVSQVIHSWGERSCIGRGANHVFQHQVPADHKGEKFANRVIGVSVSGARCMGNARAEFGVAQTWRKESWKF